LTEHYGKTQACKIMVTPWEIMESMGFLSMCQGGFQNSYEWRHSHPPEWGFQHQPKEANHTRMKAECSMKWFQ
jgi:hypothetical protein